MADMDGAWVGTWRHHCPHGPIMAQFTSLGPKYSISGTTGKTTIARGGYLAHNPTKHKAPACTFERAKPPIAESCSPGPRYYVLPSITRNRKYVAPVQHICRLPKIKLEVTPRPIEFHSSSPSARTHTRSLPIALPGPGTYTLPRLVGPNTALIHTNPCCSMRGKSEHDGFAEDLSKVKLRFSALSHQQLKLSCSPQGRRAPTPAAAPLNSHFPAAATTSKKPQVPWLSRC
uniref:Outer dense fiber of sperm tails 3 like 1 n=1 Tax=Strigops habroptila TaxID=2489341 RepID=A0A672TF73_STRHB